MKSLIGTHVKWCPERSMWASIERKVKDSNCGVLRGGKRITLWYFRRGQ